MRSDTSKPVDEWFEGSPSYWTAKAWFVAGLAAGLIVTCFVYEGRIARIERCLGPMFVNNDDSPYDGCGDEGVAAVDDDLPRCGCERVNPGPEPEFSGDSKNNGGGPEQPDN